MKPILFSTPMVQAILRGEKTQTRRIIKKSDILDMISQGFINNAIMLGKLRVGDILWVRETFEILPPNLIFYKADTENKSTGKWKPSIFMPKEAARIFLKVKNIRCERVQDISDEDAISEGVERKIYYIGQETCLAYKIYGTDKEWDESPIVSFWSLWDSINGKKYPWSSNPWVFVYEFERIEK